LDSDQALANQKRRLLANELFGQPIIIFSTRNDMISNILVPNSNQDFELPPNINLLSFEPWLNASSTDGPIQYLVRLEHLFEEGEHPMWSQPATISLSSLFGPSGVTFISPFSTLSLMI
jgi:hypothetical protein